MCRIAVSPVDSSCSPLVRISSCSNEATEISITSKRETLSLSLSLAVGTFEPELAPKGIHGHPLIRYVKLIPCCIGHAICCIRLPSRPARFNVILHSVPLRSFSSSFHVASTSMIEPSSPGRVDIFEKRFEEAHRERSVSQSINLPGSPTPTISMCALNLCVTRY